MTQAAPPRTKISTDNLTLGASTTRLNTARCRVMVSSGPERGLTMSVGPEPLIVGTDEGCDLVLPDATVSRRHATIRQSEAGATVEDMGSTNGTFYEGSRIREITVPFGATVTLGKTQLKIVPEEDVVEMGPAPMSQFGGMCGENRRMREIFALLQDIGPTDTTVLIEGETGTGKELVARALHEHSWRRQKPLVVFDCSAVPRDLLESALFGHVKGAFTGAAGPRQGAFRRAHHGTLLLDEIGELALELQPKLLRALESRTVQAVGQDDYEKVDVRVIAATNRPLKQEVRAGRFREDLYYRLAVVKLAVPALRERNDDIELLAQHFIQNALGRPRQLDPAGLEVLRRYAWPGNVRELKNLVERALHLSPPTGPLDLSRFLGAPEDDRSSPRLTAVADRVEDEVTAKIERPQVEPPPPPSTRPWAEMPTPFELPFKDAKAAVMDAFERRYLQQLIERHRHNLSRAAHEAQMDRKHLRELLKKYGLWRGGEE
ncbi:MAG: sigma 54-interacting transcriptional regulator [Myxococcota bacterium]